MREIKFRAWNNFRDVMVYENEDNSEDYWDGVIASNVGMVNALLSNGNEGYSFMQCTGLKDKNGTEIYEGDILTDHGDEGPLYVEYSNEHAMFVFVDKFDPFGVTSYQTPQISYEQFEVIGNIYEHPHLLGD